MAQKKKECQKVKKTFQDKFMRFLKLNEVKVSCELCKNFFKMQKTQQSIASENDEFVQNITSHLFLIRMSNALVGNRKEYEHSNAMETLIRMEKIFVVQEKRIIL